MTDTPDTPTIDMGVAHLSVVAKIADRDTFAMAALTGMLAYSAINPATGNWQENSSPEAVAKAAYEYADAMCKERERTTENMP